MRNNICLLSSDIFHNRLKKKRQTSIWFELSENHNNPQNQAINYRRNTINLEINFYL